MSLNDKKLDKIRQDFPVLRKENKKRIIYFDNSCVTMKPVQVIDAMNRYYNEFPACGGRSMHRLGKKVTDEFDKSREVLRKFINARKKSEAVFTKNTTEGINIVANSFGFKEGDVVVTTDKEHNSNLIPWQVLAKKGVKHVIVRSDKDNLFDPDKFNEAMSNNKNKVKLVSMVHTSNLDGTTTPAEDIIKIAHDNNALVMLDAAQSVPHKEIDVKRLDVDFLACSGHKMLGPSGTGIFYGKQHLLEEMKPFIVGGDTVKETTYETADFEEPPEKFEAGLQNYAGMYGLAEAAKYLMRIGRDNISKWENILNKKITEGLSGLIDKGTIKLIGPKDTQHRSGIFSFNIKGNDPHEIAMILDTSNNILIRSGAHCVHSWFNAHKMNGSARASLYLYNTEEECDVFINSIKEFVKRFW